MNSEQLQLDLRMPWDGHSPRFLTKGATIVSVTASGASRVERYEFVEQLRLLLKGAFDGS